jgi:DNA-binding NtrC family response regulator
MRHHAGYGAAGGRMHEKRVVTGGKLPRLEQTQSAKRVLIFSPDPDLAKSIALLLERQYEIVSVTRLEYLRERISSTSPDLMLIDLFSFQGEIAKLLVVLQSSRVSRPIIFMRGYRHWMFEIEEALQKMGAIIFYKPVDILLIADAINQIVGDQKSSTQAKENP